MSKYSGLPDVIGERFEKMAERPPSEVVSNVSDINMLDAILDLQARQLSQEGLDPKQVEWVMEQCMRWQLIADEYDLPHELTRPIEKLVIRMQDIRSNRNVMIDMQRTMRVRNELVAVENKKTADDSKAATERDAMQWVLTILVAVTRMFGRDGAERLGKELRINVNPMLLESANTLLNGAVVDNDEEPV